jgi:DNA-binding HxlR family transcriptional regulator
MYDGGMSNGRTYGDQCGVARSLDIIGERWALLIVRDLFLGPKRFSDLMSGLAGASPNVITQRLHDLTRDGVIRQRELGPPARVRVYELTDWGRELEPVILHLGQWGEQAPVSEGARWSLDSLLFALRAKADPGRLTGVGELRIGDQTIVVDAGAAGVRMWRGTADRPDSSLTTDRETLRGVCFGQQGIDDAVKSGTMSFDGTDAAVAGLKDLLLALIR